ncbi:hypothetical protein DDR33_24045 [Pararcticibacter amylolyticus]|uniref:Uncharacterized protein n=1 Tax=Pararcticibacter amylolyticus TaxID=2173175 RepID=A0A2U2P9M6_9SPHI|nr:hypothetical protein DDR33_24045 [Pararcticibacter amylolyticus]
MSGEAKEGVDALGLVTTFGEVGAAIAKTEPTASQALISSTTKVLGVAGKVLGATAALSDFSTIANKGFSNATAADWTKLGISAGSLLLKSNPYTIGFGIIYGIADMSGYNPVDYIYNKTIIP